MADVAPFDFDVMLTARGLAAQELKRAEVWGRDNYVIPDIVPVLTNNPQWAATTALGGGMTATGNSVYFMSKTGTTGSTAPTGTGQAIADGTVIWTYAGYLTPQAYANSTVVAQDQIICAGTPGKRYIVVTAGTTAGSGAGPTGNGSAITDGTAVFAYVGPQVDPIVSLSATAPAGTTLQTAGQWNGTGVSVIGGTMIQVPSNGRGTITSLSGDGTVYSNSGGGGGSLYTKSDGPLLGLNFFPSCKANIWVDGKLVAFVQANSSASYFLVIDSRGLPQPRAMRTIRFETDSNAQIVGFFGVATDTFQAVTAAHKLKMVGTGDSFLEGQSLAQPLVLSYGYRLAHAMGIEDYRTAGIGGTGILQPNVGLNAKNNFDRFAFDVLAQNPTVWFHQNSQNDQNGVNASNFTVAQVQAAQDSMIAQAKSAGIQPIIVGVWNNLTSPITGVPAQINTAVQTSAVSANVPFIDWSTYLTGGGYIGNVSGAGNASIYTGTDAVHPSLTGHIYRYRRILEPVRAAIQTLSPRP